eukprot:gi/632957154/ref/XP_007894319.1/ PREDICTED: Na(+)/H(+) exchange regulatory cofactor NHE-RF3-like isoform X2 [Callorhinchus milii]
MEQTNDVEDTDSISPCTSSRKFTFNPKEGIDNPALVITDDLETAMSLKPRVCALSKKESEMFGFYLRSEVGKEGHIIRQVEWGSYAQRVGLCDADRVLEVNGEFVADMEHSQVIEKVRQSGNKVSLLVVEGVAYEEARACHVDIPQLVKADNGTPVPPPRVCHVTRGPRGFGFELSPSKGIRGHFTLTVTEAGEAEKALVQTDDRLIEVNGENVEDCTYLQVSKRIKESGEAVTLLVAGRRTVAYYRDKGLTVVPAMASFSHVAFRPRSLHLLMGSSGFGFLLKAEERKTGTIGQYLRELDAGSPAEASGMRDGDRLLAVNGKNLEGVEHETAVTMIRASGDSVTLTVIDPQGDAFFTRLGLSPLIALQGEQREEDRERGRREARDEESATENRGEGASAPKPRFGRLVQNSEGFGFQVYSIADETGTYIKQVAAGGVAARAGLRDWDVLVEVNGENVESSPYEDVVCKIQASGQEVALLVMSQNEYWHCKENHIPLSSGVPGGGGERQRGNGSLPSDSTSRSNNNNNSSSNNNTTTATDKGSGSSK